MKYRDKASWKAAVDRARCEIAAMTGPRTPAQKRRILAIRVDLGSADRSEYQEYYGKLRGWARWLLR